MTSKYVEEMVIRPSEKPILKLASMGDTIWEIAEKLNLKPTVVADRQKKMKERNGCKNLTHLVARAIRNGEIL